MERTRNPAVAGLFYPKDKESLGTLVDTLLSRARTEGAPGGKRLPKALIVPHAGYVYSGPVAARGYSLLEPGRDRITRVVLLGPSHRVFLQGLALPGARSQGGNPRVRDDVTTPNVFSTSSRARTNRSSPSGLSSAIFSREASGDSPS